MPKRSSIDKDFVMGVGKDAKTGASKKLNTESLENCDEGKNPHAVALGRLGGRIGGKVRAKVLTKEQRRRIASIAAKARWHGK